MKSYDVLVVGAGHAGAQLAQSLRQLKYSGSVALIGDEADPPYERPSLSKEYLSGKKDFERILIRPPGFWAQHDIDLRLGHRVTAVDPAGRRVSLENGEALAYGALVWAAGGDARRLTCAGHHLEGVHTVRNRTDVDQLLSELERTSDVVIIGGGYIGLEAAAVLRHLGKSVTLFEAADRVLARVAAEPLSRFFEAEHQAQGVHLHTHAVIDCIEEIDGRASGVRLSTGAFVPAQMVIVGIGITPAVAPLIAAGAAGGNGVEVDETCRTSLADIYAIGDCALHNNRFADGAKVRLESLQNANDQARVVAKALTGAHEPYDSVPWFWSNQYDLRLQTVGLSNGHDQIVVRGDISARSFAVIYLRDGHVVALDCVNATKDYVQGRALVATAAQIDAGALADATRPLKDLI